MREPRRAAVRRAQLVEKRRLAAEEMRNAGRVDQKPVGQGRSMATTGP
jgi:hypothetical protein